MNKEAQTKNIGLNGSLSSLTFRWLITPNLVTQRLTPASQVRCTVLGALHTEGLRLHEKHSAVCVCVRAPLRAAFR